MRSGIHIAETKEEKRAVYRFRYDVYVEEMGRYHGTADHENRLLVEPEDEYSRITYAAEGGKVVATARFTWGGDAPFPARQIEQYGLADSRRPKALLIRSVARSACSYRAIASS